MKKGTYARSSAWYSIVEAAEHHDAGFQAWRYLLQRVAQALLRSGANLTKLQEQAAQSMADAVATTDHGVDEGLTKEQHKALMQAMKKKAGPGQQIALCPLLMHNANFFNMRLLVLFGQFLWSEQSWLSTEKVNPTQNCSHAILLSTGHGEDFLRLIWQDTTSDASTWARLGISLFEGQVKTDMAPYVDPDTGLHVPGVEEEEIPERVASFLWHCIEERFWSYAVSQHCWPGAFAAILSEAGHGSALQRAQLFWRASLHAEGNRNQYPTFFALRENLYWMDWPVCQLPFRMLAQCNFLRTPEIVRFLMRFWTRLGDTKVTEETNKILRRMEQKDQDQKESTEMRMFHALIGHDAVTAHGTANHTMKRTPLEWRKVNSACVPSDSYYEFDTSTFKPPAKGWKNAFDAKGVVMPRSWNVDNMTEPKKTYISKRPADIRHSIAAAAAMMWLHERQAWHEAGTVWQTCAILPHTFVQQKSGCRGTAVTGHGTQCPLWFVLACATYGARVCEAHRHSDNLIVLNLRREWSWIHVTDIREWEHIRVKWVVSTIDAHQYGFLAAAPIGSPVPAVIPALCATGPRKLMKTRQDGLVAHCRSETADGSPSKFPEGMPDLMKHLLGGHPDAEYWRTQWSKVEAHAARRARKRQKTNQNSDDNSASSSDSSSSSSASDNETAWLEGLALDEIHDQSEFQDRRKKLEGEDHQSRQKRFYQNAESKLKNGNSHEPSTDHGKAENGEADKSVAAPEASTDHGKADNGEADNGEADLTCPGVDRRVVTRVPWAWPFLPGHPASQSQIPDSVLSCTFHLNESRHQWFSKYLLHPNFDIKLPANLKQKSKSKTFDPSCSRDEHAAFQEVLKWLWDKHMAVAPGAMMPPVVSAALVKCQHCKLKVACEAMAVLRASRPAARAFRRLRLSTAGDQPDDTNVDAGTQDGIAATTPGTAACAIAHSTAELETAHSSAKPPVLPPAPSPAQSRMICWQNVHCVSIGPHIVPLTAHWRQRHGQATQATHPRWHGQGGAETFAVFPRCRYLQPGSSPLQVMAIVCSVHSILLPRGLWARCLMTSRRKLWLSGARKPAGSSWTKWQEHSRNQLRSFWSGAFLWPLCCWMWMISLVLGAPSPPKIGRRRRNISRECRRG